MVPSCLRGEQDGPNGGLIPGRWHTVGAKYVHGSGELCHCMLQIHVLSTRLLFRAVSEGLRVGDGGRARVLLGGIVTGPPCWKWLNRRPEIELSAGQPLNDNHDARA